MNDPTQNTTPQVPSLLDQLKKRLNDTLADYGEEADEEILAEQSRILDRMFRYLAERSTHTGRIDEERLRVALKTQNQYRYTVKEIARIKGIATSPHAETKKT